jgi:hypothetical protein
MTIDNEAVPILNIDDIKIAISEISQKPLDLHPQEFENVHNDLNRVLSGIDGL